MIHLAVLSLLLPLVFFGCGSGSDGAAGAAGAAGAPGEPGAGVQANETCVLCHGAGQTYDVAAVHAITPNIATDNTILAFTDNGANKVVTVSFDFPDPSVDLTTLNPSNSAQLLYPKFYLAKLVPGTSTPGAGTEPNLWVRTVYGERTAANLTKVGPTSYTYRFDYNVLAADAGLTHRAVIYFSGLPNGLIAETGRSSDAMPDGSAVTVARNIVATNACEQCHNPIGGGAAVWHGGRLNKAETCGVCHRTVQGARDNTVLSFNPESGLFEGTGQAFFPYMVHKIHAARQRGFTWVFHNKDYNEVTYPQDIRNCKTCHKGADGDNWKNRPSQAACGSCHSTVNFATGAGHSASNLALANNQFCSSCHTPALIEGYHATENKTPNSQLHAGLVKFEYGIDNVWVVNSSNRAVVKFWIKKDGAFVDLRNTADNTVKRPSGFSGGPSFLVAYANNVTSPQDYSNFGKKAGQPASVSIVGLPITVTGSEPSQFTVTLPASAAYPSGAKMRSIALQGYFTQTNAADMNGDGVLDNVARHTPSVAFSGAYDNTSGTWKRDAVRRVNIKSGYVDGDGNPVSDPANFSTATPIGCLECHEFFEGHGGNRVNNVQVCVMCHNPSLTSSGRTVTAGQTIPSELQQAYPGGPSTYPEVSNNLKDLIHGIHSASKRVSPFEDVRNRGTSGVYYYDFSEVTFPGNLKNCEKCHYGSTTPAGATPTSFKANLPTGVSFSTTKVTTGNSGETAADIDTIARVNVPNPTDLVTTPTAAACGMCHNSETAVSHFQLMGGKVQAERSYAELPVPTMSAIVEPVP